MMDRRAFIIGGIATLTAPLAATAQQAIWSPGPKALGPGVWFRVIEQDRDKGSYTLQVRYPAEHTVGPHKRKHTEHVTVLSGTLLIGWGDVFDPAKFETVRAGEHVEVPAGKTHFSAVRKETVMEIANTRIDGFLVKPFRKQQLLETLRRHTGMGLDERPVTRVM